AEREARLGAGPEIAVAAERETEHVAQVARRPGERSPRAGAQDPHVAGVVRGDDIAGRADVERARELLVDAARLAAIPAERPQPAVLHRERHGDERRAVRSLHDV